MSLGKASAVFTAALALILTTGTPAQAHGADAPDATNYLVKVVRAPQLPGLEIITIEAGARLQLTNKTGRNIEVLGYQGEPYLDVRPDGVYENIHSPATYLNITIAHVDPPAHADPTVPPSWKKVSDKPIHRWHDQRVLWTSPQPPPQVAANPDAPHHIRDWTVSMRAGATPLELAGTLEWIPPPAAGAWWVAAIVGAALIALLGLLRRRAITSLLAVLVIAAGVLALIYAIARERDAGNVTFGDILIQLLASQLWPTVTSLAAIAAGIYALARREGDFVLALGGAAVGLFAGMVNAAVFHRSVTPVHWPAANARLVIAAIIILGAGASIAAMLRLRGIPAGRGEQPVE